MAAQRQSARIEAIQATKPKASAVAVGPQPAALSKADSTRALTKAICAAAADLTPSAFEALISESLVSQVPTSRQASAIETLRAAVKANKPQKGWKDHIESIERQLEALAADVDTNWKQGYDDQADMMDDIVGEVLGWIDECLEYIGDERLETFPTIRKALEFMGNTVMSLRASGSRSKFEKACNGYDTYGEWHLSTIIFRVWTVFMTSAIMLERQQDFVKECLTSLSKQGDLQTILNFINGKDEEGLPDEDIDNRMNENRIAVFRKGERDIEASIALGLNIR